MSQEENDESQLRTNRIRSWLLTQFDIRTITTHTKLENDNNITSRFKLLGSSQLRCDISKKLKKKETKSNFKLKECRFTVIEKKWLTQVNTRGQWK